MATKAQNPKEAEPTNEQITKTEDSHVILNPTITPDLANALLTGNFDHIRKNFGIGKWNKAKTPEEKRKLLEDYKKLIDSMNYMARWL